MAAIGKGRELRRHWQQVRELMLQEADVAALSSRVRLAVLKDAKLDVTATRMVLTLKTWISSPIPGAAARTSRNAASATATFAGLTNCPPSALMRQIGWVEEGRISGSS